MAFDLSKFVKIGPFLQFLGYMVALGGLIWHTHWYGVPTAYGGIGLSFAGYLYDKLYP